MAFLNKLEMMANLPLRTGRGNPFPKTLTIGDFVSGTSVATYSGKYNKLGEYKIPAQQQVNVGQGAQGTPYNQGYLYVFLKDEQANPVEITGKFRIVVSNANETERVVVFEEYSTVLHGDLSDRAKKIALPEDKRKTAKEDDKIILEFMPDADAVTHPVTKANSTILIPATVYQ
jgi:hypothetical protein